MWGGNSTLDNCLVCDDNSANDDSTCSQDCQEAWGGSAVVDNCGVCDDNPANDCPWQVLEPSTNIMHMRGNFYINGLPASPDDQLAVFDSQNVLVGIYTGTSATGQYGDLPIYGNDPGTEAVDEGAEPNEPLTLQVWQKSTSLLFENTLVHQLIPPNAQGDYFPPDLGQLTYVAGSRILLDIAVPNSSPTANAGPDQTVNQGDKVILSGSNSSDPEGNISTYLWEQTEGTSVSLSNANSITATFIASNINAQGEILKFQLTVTDTLNKHDTDSNIITVIGINYPPIAVISSYETVTEGVTVYLDGSNSSDPEDGSVRYSWTQTDGPLVQLSDPTSATPTFIAPNVDQNGATLNFTLTVFDSKGLSSSSNIIINVSWSNIAPTANAGLDQEVMEGSTVTLSGVLSNDLDDGIKTYLWEQIQGKTVVLSNTSSIRTTFIAPPCESNGLELAFQLTVTDSGLQDSATVKITITDNGISGFPENTITVTTKNSKSDDNNKEKYVALEVVGGSMVKLDLIDPGDPGDLEEIEDKPKDLPYGLFDFVVKVPQNGAKTEIVFHLPEGVPAEYLWYKYNTANKSWRDFSDHATFSTDRKKVTVWIIDGGDGDLDGIANGLVTDPSGPGSPQLPTLSTVNISGGGGGTCFVASSAATLPFCNLILSPQQSPVWVKIFMTVSILVLIGLILRWCITNTSLHNSQCSNEDNTSVTK